MAHIATLDRREFAPAVRRRGLMVLLINNFLMWTGFIMVVPLLTIYYVDNLGWAAATIGLGLAVRQFTQQGVGVFVGMLADRVGAKSLILLGMILRALGFGLMIWAADVPMLFFTLILAALGGALFESPGRAATAALTTVAERPRYFALQGVISSIGTAVGPVLGAFLFRVDFDYVVAVAAGIYMVALALTLLLLPDVQVGDATADMTAGLRLVFADRTFMIFTLLVAALWFMWAQLLLTVPLLATAITNTPDTVRWIYLINAGMSIVLQYPLVRWLSRWLPPMRMLALGMVIMALGIASLALANDLAGLLLAVSFYVAGSLIALPSQQTATAQLAKPVALGSYFGVGALALAVGGGIGTYVGGLLYEVGPVLPWLVFGGVGIAGAIGLLRLYQQTQAVVVAAD